MVQCSSDSGLGRDLGPSRYRVQGGFRPEHLPTAQDPFFFVRLPAEQDRRPGHGLWHGARIHGSGLSGLLHELARRNPMLLLLLPGLLLFRLADRQFCALLFQLPPRITRFEPASGPGPQESSPMACTRRRRSPSVSACLSIWLK